MPEEKSRETSHSNLWSNKSILQNLEEDTIETIAGVYDFFCDFSEEESEKELFNTNYDGTHMTCNVYNFSCISLNFQSGK